MIETDTQHIEFIQLLAAHERVIRASIRAVLRRSDDVDEVMQTTSIAAWNKFASLSDHDQFARWACVIARYETLKFQRKQVRDRFELNPELVMLITEEAAGEVEQRHLRLEMLTSCLQKLPEAQRSVVMRAYQPGCSIQDLAAEIGRTRDSMYQMLRRIRVVLMECVKNGFADGVRA